MNIVPFFPVALSINEQVRNREERGETVLLLKVWTRTKYH